MKKQALYSKGIHWLVLLCFLTPFFYTGCDGVNDSKVEQGKLKADSTTNDTLKKDSTLLDSTDLQIADTSHSQLNAQTDTIKSKVTSTQSGSKDSVIRYDTESYSERIAVGFPFFKKILYPEKYTFTGFALIIDAFAYSAATASIVVFSFLLILISLIIKFIEKKSLKSIVLIEVIALLAFAIAPKISFYIHDILWGYWVTITLFSLLTIYDIYLIVYWRRLKKAEQIKLTEENLN